MKQKVKSNISRRISQIESSSFSEDDIKLFLIEIRDYLEDETFLREVCDFVAHPRRNKGICHKRIDSRYGKQKFAKEGVEKIADPSFINAHKDKPDSFFTDQILSYIETNKIDKILFNIIIIEGINEIDNYLFIKFYGKNKEEIERIIRNSYRKEGKNYILNSSVSDDNKRFLDDVLKFIRGTITGKAAFNQSDIKEQLISGLTRISNQANISINISKVEDNFSDLMVCILCILHDAQFNLFDESKAHSFISIEKGKSGELELCLRADANNFSFPIVSTNIPISEYVKETEEALLAMEFKELPYIRANRNEAGNLELST